MEQSAEGMAWGGAELDAALPPTVALGGGSGGRRALGGVSLPEAIGPYRLREVLGEGGFGIVYLAEQEEPMRREVALKVIKPGMDSFDILRRFEGERQALARMEHPNIAGALDAGTTAGDLPYFAMELVRGLPITVHCDERRLSLRERLELFRPVCLAVHHAHQKAILHRDLKPSNILVAERDGKPLAKVIDFGIAKALDGFSEHLDRSLYRTMEGMVAGTPQYMSPEQAGAQPDLDTRCDVYALGVILYELLVGSTPLSREGLRQLSLGEVLQQVREGDVKPLRVALGPAGPGREELAARRSTSGTRLAAAVQGELDWIVQRALEKDRERRYHSARSLADDLERFLLDKPVEAGPPSRAYELRKFLRRHQVAAGGVAAVLVVLAGGVAASLWQARKAEQARAQAESERQQVLIVYRRELEERRNAEESVQFWANVFRIPDPTQDGRTITLVEALQNAERSLEKALVGTSWLKVKLQKTLGNTYLALGLVPEAMAVQEKVLEYYVANVETDDPDFLLAKQNLASSYYTGGRRKEALQLREEVLAGRRALGIEGAAGGGETNLLDAINDLAKSYYREGREKEALGLREEILERRMKLHGPGHLAVLRAMYNLAKSYFAAGRLEEAVKLREEVFAGRRKVLGSKHLETLAALADLAKSYQEVGRKDEALRMGEEVLAGRRQLLGPNHYSTLAAMGVVAGLWHEKGDWHEALRQREELLGLSRNALGREHPDTLGAMLNLSISYNFAERQEESLRLREEVYGLRQKVLGPEHPVTLSTMAMLAASYSSWGRLEQGIQMQESYLKRIEGLWPRGDERVRKARQDLVDYYVEDGQDEAAAALRWETRLDLVTK